VLAELIDETDDTFCDAEVLPAEEAGAELLPIGALLVIADDSFLSFPQAKRHRRNADNIRCFAVLCMIFMSKRVKVLGYVLRH
jgi:hypothetical protein